MALQINDSLQNFSPKPLDFKYCKFSGGVAMPYNGVAEALAAVILPYRYQGLTLLVADQGTAKEFWFYAGTDDKSLVPKDGGLAKVAYSGSYNDLLDLPTLPPAPVNPDWDASSGLAEILNKPTVVSAFANDAGYLTHIAVDNGISLLKGIIGLGQDVGDPLGMGSLNTSREILLNGSTFQFTDFAGTTVFLPAEIDLASSPDSGNDFAVNVVADWAATLMIIDRSYGTPGISLIGGGASSVSNNGNYNRMEIMANSSGDGSTTTGLYIYPGSDSDNFTGRAYIAPIEPAAFVPGSGLSFDETYLQALVVFNRNYDSGNGTPNQGTFAAVAQTWDTTSSPTLILGNVHQYNQAGPAAKLLDLQVSGSTRFSVMANGNAVIGGMDNGATLQVQQPMQYANVNSALNVTSNWSTSETPSLIQASVSDFGSADQSKVLDLQVNSANVFSVNKSGEITTGDPGQGAGAWKLGQVKNQDGIVLNTQQYVQVTIDGQNYWLALIATSGG